MNKFFKKFSIMFVMSLILSLGFCVSAFATDDGVVGTANLNNTTDNSAKIGDVLQSPEIGWKRYDDADSKIVFSNNFNILNDPVRAYYNSYAHFDGKSGGSIKFSFYGTKLRLYDHICSNRNRNSRISFDGGKTFESCTSYGKDTTCAQRLYYEKTGLEKDFHSVIIDIPVNEQQSFVFDCFDIDQDGYLLPYGESITLDKSKMNLNVGDSQQLTVTTTPVGAQVTWKSSDSSIATVDPTTGKVTGVKEGTCTITATTPDEATATCSVTISKGGSISLNKPTTNLTIGDSDTLIATTTPSAVNVKWSSSNTSVATVDSSGKVTAICEGTAIITATTTDGSNLSATCTVSVNKSPAPTPEPTDADKIVNIAHAKGDNTNNPGGDVIIIFHGEAETTLSVVKTADVKEVWVGDTVTYTIVVTNTGTKTAKAVVVNDPAPNHVDFNVNAVTTTQGTVDSSSTSKNIVVNVGDIPPAGTVTITIPATVIA